MFESIKGRTKENLNNAKSILGKIDNYLYNRELINIIGEYLSMLLNSSKYYVDFSSDNEICIRRKKSNDMFHLLVTPSLNKINTIGIHVVEKNGLYEKEITAQFKEDQIVVTKMEIEKHAQGKKQEITSISNKTSLKNYLSGKLRYRYEYDTETCFRIHQNYSCATLSETFIDLDNNAVKRTAHISEDVCYDDPAAIVYYESDNCELLPFDNKYITSVEKENMTLSTQQKFEEFINGNNNIVNLKKQK